MSYPLTSLTLSGNQTVQALLADGSTITFTFIYRAAIQRWTVDVSYPKANFTKEGHGLTFHWNTFRLWRDVIPFGLQITTADGTEPFLASDLAPGANGAPARVTITVLDQTNGNTDVTDVEEKYYSATATPAY